jgi:predicted HTH transcriptional regulator
MSELQNLIEETYEKAKKGRWDRVLPEWKDIPLIAFRCSRYQKESSGWTFLHLAAYFGHEIACRELIRLGASVNRLSREGKTAADVAEEKGHTALADLLRRAFEYIRVGSYKKSLKDFPEKERQLWNLFERVPFELQIAKPNVTSDEVLKLLDYPSYFDLTNQPLPDNREGILEKLSSERMIIRKDGGMYDITNLGGIIFAKDLNSFDRIARKAIRVVVYNNANRVETIREQTGLKGYGVGFEGAMSFINNLLPENEIIDNALRKSVRLYPEIAIRELVANAIIHQDFTIRGTGPMIEIFSDRIEVSNPGIPLIDPLRFIDEPPQSRNEALASFLRRINICEERGSGVDKVIFQVEFNQLPAPEFSVTSNHTKATLFAHKDFAEMDKLDRIRACYQHACLRYVSNDFLTNKSLRERFSIAKKNHSMASRIIADTVEKKLIKHHDPDSQSKKNAKYIPFWG